MRVPTFDIDLEEHIDDSLKKSMAVLIPAHNENHFYIYKLLDELESKPYITKIIVIDDHSTDGTAEFIRSVYKQSQKIKVLKPKDGRKRPFGKEWAIKKGFLELYQNDFDFVDLAESDDSSDNSYVEYVGLMDGDGQHSPVDLERMLYAAKETKTDVVCGYRNRDDMPLIRRIANWGIPTILRVWGGFPINDPLFGQKVIHVKYIKRLSQDLQEHGGYRVEESLINHLTSYGANFYQIPVKAEYSNCSGKSGMGLLKTSWMKNMIYAFKVGIRIRNKLRLKKLSH